jgi:dienelactone hydrolase
LVTFDVKEMQMKKHKSLGRMMTQFSFGAALCLSLWTTCGIAQQLPEQYREKFSDSYPIRMKQHFEIKAYVDKLLEHNIQESLASFKPDFFSIADYEDSLVPYRKRIGDFYGYPPPAAKDGKITQFIKVGEDKYCTIYRAWIEVMENVNAYGLYMVPKHLNGKAPLIIAQHGGGGNPEAICDLDTRVNYHSFGPEAVKRGYIVWAPALAMRCEYGGDPVIPEANRELLDAKLKYVGTSIIGVELHKIIQSTKALIKNRPEIDAERVGMTGLSWGGTFTLYTSAVWPLIKVAVPSAGFREYESTLRSAVADDSKVRGDASLFGGIGAFQALGLICPRPCMLQFGEKDTLYNMDEVKREAGRASSFYKKLGIEDKFVFLVHPAGHEFDIPSLFEFLDRYLKP